MKKLFIIAALLAATGCSESLQRKVKDVQSNYLGGLERTCTVYDEGKVTRKYSGTFDITGTSRRLLFDIDGKRTIIMNATVICDED